jgi:hypothetical protein
MYEILTSKQFYEKYQDKLKPGEFRFITKAFRQSDNTVALFEKENYNDCYFQLPGWKTTQVPENRRWIYKLPKNSIKPGRYIEMEDGRYKIPVSELDLFSDPYEDEPVFDDFVQQFQEAKSPPTEEVKKEEMTLLEKIELLEKQIDMKVNNLEALLQRLIAMEKKVSEALQRLEYVSKN